MGYRLNSLKGGYIGEYIREYHRAYKGRYWELRLSLDAP